MSELGDKLRKLAAEAEAEAKALRRIARIAEGKEPKK